MAAPGLAQRVVGVEGKPSFDCRKARSETERIICATPHLSRLDHELAKLYRARLAKLKGVAAEAEKRRQGDWGAARNQCGTNIVCVEENYRRRLAELDGQPALQWSAQQATPDSRQDGGASPSKTTAQPPNAAPALDCGKARSATEQVHCAHEKVMGPLMEEYGKALVAASDARSAALNRTGEWGILIISQCGANIVCLAEHYRRWIAELRGQPIPARQEDSAIPPKLPIGTVQSLPNPIRLIGNADQPCDMTSATLARLRKSLAVAVPDGLTVQAEELRNFQWKVSGAAPAGPAYLVLAADTPIRVKGAGFYALTPGAKGPFRIQQFVDQTRIIIPLHVKGAPQSGEIKVRPLVAGPLKVSAAIVAYTQCGENPDPAPIAFDLTVEPGAPEIVIDDRFDLARPDQIIASPDRTRRLEIYGPRYRLIDEATGGLLGDDVGTEVRFSPAGRFVIAVSENRFVVRDSVDGKIVYRPSADDSASEGYSPRTAYMLSWDNSDSFLFPIAQHVGAKGVPSYVQNLLMEAEARIYCPCTAQNFDFRPSFKIDLENNITLAGSEAFANDHLVFSLTSQEEINGLSSMELVVPTSVPTSWDMIEGLKLTHLWHFVSDYEKTDGPLQAASGQDTEWWRRHVAEQQRAEAVLQRYVVRPITIDQNEQQDLPISRDPLRIASRALGNVDMPQVEIESRNDKRLEDFGIEINANSSAVALDLSSRLKAARSLLKNVQLTDDAVWAPLQPGVNLDKCWFASLGNKRLEHQLIGNNDLPVEQIKVEGFQLTLFSITCTELGSRLYVSPFLHDSRRPGRIIDLSRLLDPQPNWSRPVKGWPRISATATLVLNRYLVVWMKGENTAAVFDIDRQKLIGFAEELPTPDATQRILLSRDLERLIKLDKDGGFHVIALKSPQRDNEGHLTEESKKADVLLSGRIVDDEVVVWAPIGKFDSTPEGASYVNLRFPGRSGQYTLEQFRKDFHVDNLVQRVMAGEKFKAPRVIDFPPAITVEPNFTGDSVTAKINVVGNDPVEEIRLYQDGVMTDAIKVAAGAKSIDINAKRLRGARWVSFLARGPSGLYSQPVTFDAGPSANARRRVHLVAIGIDHYDDQNIQQLRFAASDATRFAKTLEGKTVSDVEIVSKTLLTDAAASREAILAKLDETIVKAQPGDSVILFVAGHGVQDEKTKAYYLATSATKIDDIPHSSLAWTDVAAALAKAHTKIAVFLDTCQSGAAGTNFFATNDASVGALLDRAPSGILIFSASKGRELSNEDEKWGGGIFTKAVADALTSSKTDLNKNGAIEASELYANVKRSVVEATWGTGNPQTPWFARNDMVGDFIPF
jgi:uncharacterized protein